MIIYVQCSPAFRKPNWLRTSPYFSRASIPWRERAFPATLHSSRRLIGQYFRGSPGFVLGLDTRIIRRPFSLLIDLIYRSIRPFSGSSGNSPLYTYDHFRLLSMNGLGKEDIIVDNTTLEMVEQYTYLGQLIHIPGSLLPEIKRRIQL